MGQFIVVSSVYSATADNTLSRCIKTAESLFDQTPLSQCHFQNTAVATFARHAVNDESGRVRVFKDIKAWCLGVGTWIHHDGVSAKQQAYRLAAAHGNPAKLETGLGAIDGTYSFLTGNTCSGNFCVVTDPVGQLHVYTLQLADAILISTSALLLAHVGNADWDPLAVREFLAKGSVYEERSLFRGVTKIPPASIQFYENGKRKAHHTYWSVRDRVASPLSAQRSLQDFSSATQAGVAEAFRQFPDPALDLTGGFDSRILLASARKACPNQPLHTIVTGPEGAPDVVAARHIADVLGLQHERLDGASPNAKDRWRTAQSALPLVDGECNILQYANILFIHRQLAGRFGVSINGSGGELIRGYWWELLFPRVGARNHFDPSRIASRRYATDPWAEALMAYNYADTLTDHFAGVISRANAELSGARNTTCLDNIYLRLRMHRWQGRIASATNRVWPCLSPLLFRAPMEAALSASISLRRNGRMARRLLLDMDPKLAHLPMAGGYPAIPITPKTLPQFVPLGKEYVQRITNRLRRTTSASSRLASNRQTHVQELARLDEVADMLMPPRMLTAELYDSQALRNVTAAIAKGHVSAERSGRIITLEAVARLRRHLRN